VKSEFLSIEAFNEKLQQWRGKQIKVSKLELHDLDEVTISLDSVTYEKNDMRLDDYEGLYTLQLNGDGTIQTGTSNAQPLPSALYEIPLEADALQEFNGEQFIVSTTRGVYKIELA